MIGAPAVAVIMPAFNAARTIARALESARGQTLAAIEIIVVDDGSDDATAAIVAATARVDCRVRLIRQANAGPMAARNRAIAASTARYIAPLDADDLWRPGYLAAMAAALAGDRAAGFAYALHHVIDAADRIIATPPTPRLAGHAFGRHLLVNVVGCGSAAVFRRAALLAAGGYDPITRGWGGAEDYLLQLRIAAERRIACVPRRLVGYRRVAASLSDDPPRMAEARRRAVRAALREQGGPPLPVARWVSADADRTAAALLALRGRWRPAARLAMRALAGDPAATLADLARRARNRLGRAAGPIARRFPDAAAAPEEEEEAEEMAIEPLLAARLTRLARWDAARSAAERAPGIALQPPETDDQEIVHAAPFEPRRRP